MGAVFELCRRRLALGWSKPFAWLGHADPEGVIWPPVPVTAWIPCHIRLPFRPPSIASVFIVGACPASPSMILTSSGVSSVNRAYYWTWAVTWAQSPAYLVSRIAISSSALLAHRPSAFHSWGLYYLVRSAGRGAEILGAKYGLGWYIQFHLPLGYANVYATLVIMSLLCVLGFQVKLLFSVRDRLLVWQKGFIR